MSRVCRPALVCLLVSGLALSACGGSSAGSGPSQPPASAFSEGTCRTIAPDVLQIARDSYRLGKGPEVAKPVLERLTASQARLRTIADGVEPAYAPALSKLVIAVGLVRLQARVGSYHVETGAHLQQSSAEVIGVCTHPNSP